MCLLKQNNYGSGSPSDATSSISAILLSGYEATSLFQVLFKMADGEYYPVPTVGATKINDHFRAIANTNTALFTGGLANIEYHASALNWVSGGKVSPKVVVTNAAQNAFYTSLGAEVTQLNIASSSIPEDTDVLVLDYSSYSVWNDGLQNTLYEVTAEFMSRTATEISPKGIIIGGDSSFYKWTHYGSCSYFPGNRALQEYGITFICDYWATRQNNIEPSTFTYLQESLYHSLLFLSEIDGRAFSDSDFDSLMDVNILQRILPAISFGCVCSRGDDVNAPTNSIFDVFKPLLVEVLNDLGCRSIAMPMDTTYERYCGELIYTDANLYKTASDVDIAITSDIFPGLNKGIDSSNTIPSKLVHISTHFCNKQSTGLWAVPGHSFTVTIPDDYIDKLSIFVGIWNGDLRKFDSWPRIPAELNFKYPIDSSTITIANGFGGPIYIDIPCGYFEDIGSYLEFDVLFTEVVQMGYFIRGETTEDDWNNQLLNANAPWVELEADYTIYTIPKDYVVDKTYETIQSVVDNWSIIVSDYAEFRDQIPDLFKERGIIDIKVAVAYMFASYPINGPFGEIDNLLTNPNGWGWLHEMGHRFERGNSYGPEAGAMWNMFNGNVEVFTNVFSCIGILFMQGDNSRCVNNNGAPDTIGSSGWHDLGPFQKLDFYLMLRDGFTWEAFTNTLTRGRTFRFPDNDDDKRTRLWLLLSERVKRNLYPLFDMYEIDVVEDGLYNQIILSDLAKSFIRMNNPPVDISEKTSKSTIITGDLTCNQSGPEQLFSSSKSCSFSNGGKLQYNHLDISEFNNELSISFWIKLNSFPVNSISIIEQSINDDSNDWKISLGSSGLLSLYFNDNLIIQSLFNLLQNEWYHILITSDDSKNIIYINGNQDILADSNELISNNISSELKFNAQGLFDGSLSEFSIFNYVLSNDRAIAHYSPSPFQFKPWISPRYLPDPIDDCSFIPQDITACQTREGLFGSIPSQCDQCLDYLCNGASKPTDEIDCSPVCSSGTIIDAFSGRCLDCDSSCKECSSANDPLSCTSCNLDLGSLTYLQENQCVYLCDSNYYLTDGVDGPNTICEKCDDSCTSCNGPNDNNCLSCETDNILYNNQCLDNCPIELYEFNNECVETCPSGTFANGNICENCHSSCQTCVNSMDHCLSCDENGSTPYFTSDFNTCSSSCNTGYYNELDTHECKTCSDQCETCEENSDNCTSCDRNGSTPYYFYNTCLSSCPEYTNENDITFVCEGCDTNGEFPYELDGNCVSECNVDQVIYYYQCVDVCPAHFYDNDGFCNVCDDNCVSCLNVPDFCTSCGSENALLYNSQCVNECPFNTYENNGNCIDCHETCETCSGSLNTECNTCNFGLYLHSSGECLAECNELSTYPDDNERKCKSCDETCFSCFDETSFGCLSCSNELFLNSNNQCVSSCTEGYYENRNTNQCDICNEICLTCSNSPTFCTSCDSSSDNPVFIESENTCKSNCDSVTLDGECVSSCPFNYFENEDKECVLCNTECQTCSFTQDHCLTCDAAGSTPFLYLQTCISNCREFNEIGFEFECINSCPKGFYDDNTSISCISCPEYCLECENSENCLECNPLSENNKLYNGDCLENCPSNTFTQLNTCIECNESCKTCSDDTENNCLSCFDNFHLENGNCVENIDICTENTWNLNILSIDINNIEKNYSIDNFNQQVLCISGTSEDFCIPYGSKLENVIDIDFIVSGSVLCSHDCEESFNHQISQNFKGFIQSNQEMKFIISLIEDVEIIYSQFVSEIEISLENNSNILNGYFSAAENMFRSNLNNNIDSICSNLISNLNDEILSNNEILQLESIGEDPLHVCNVIFDDISRCICDDSVNQMNEPCRNLRDDLIDNFNDNNNAICHPNHCDNSALPDNYISLELDTEYSTYSDDYLIESISILNNWVNENPLSMVTDVHVYKVNRGSVILIINLMNNNGNDDDTLINLYNNLVTDDINMKYRIIKVEIFPPLSSSTPSPTNSVIIVDSSSRTPVSVQSSSVSPSIIPSSSATPSAIPLSSASTTPSGQFQFSTVDDYTSFTVTYSSSSISEGSFLSFSSHSFSQEFEFADSTSGTSTLTGQSYLLCILFCVLFLNFHR